MNWTATVIGGVAGRPCAAPVGIGGRRYRRDPCAAALTFRRRFSSIQDDGCGPRRGKRIRSRSAANARGATLPAGSDARTRGPSGGLVRRAALAVERGARAAAVRLARVRDKGELRPAVSRLDGRTRGDQLARRRAGPGRAANLARLGPSVREVLPQALQTSALSRATARAGHAISARRRGPTDQPSVGRGAAQEAGLGPVPLDAPARRRGSGSRRFPATRSGGT